MRLAHSDSVRRSGFRSASARPRLSMLKVKDAYGQRVNISPGPGRAGAGKDQPGRGFNILLLQFSKVCLVLSGWGLVRSHVNPLNAYGYEQCAVVVFWSNS